MELLEIDGISERGQMKKVIKTMLTVVAFAAVSMGSLSTAYADDSEVVTRSAKGLSSYQVFQSAGAELTDGQTLATKLRGADLGIAVIPKREVTSKSAEEIAGELRSNPSVKYSTVIVVLDGSKDILGVSSNNQEVKARLDSYMGNEPVSDAGWLLITNAEKIFNVEKDLKAEADKRASDAAKAAETERTAAALKPWTPVVIAAFVLISASLLFLRRRLRTGNKDDVKRYGFRKMPKKLRESVDSFRKTIDLHKNLDSRYYPQLAIYNPCLKLIARFVELEETMEKLDISDNRRMILEVEYVERLDKLKEAIGEDYYLSILKEPEHWEDPKGKMKRVKDAVVAMSAQVLESIKQINDSSNLEFKIALDSIIGDKNVKVEDLYKK